MSRHARWQRALLFSLIALSVIALGLVGGCAPTAPSEGGGVHACAGAGQWFPADPAELRAQIDGFLKAAEQGPTPAGRIRAITVPHAGYQYSGATAAYAYRLLRGQPIPQAAQAPPIPRVIILAISHRYPIDGASVLDVDAYETPLGRIPVDRDAVKALLKADGFKTMAAAHTTEHSDENQLPFLQSVLGEFKLVSILVGGIDERDPAKAAEQCERLAKGIRPLVDDQTLLVGSSDFTHYGTNYGYLPFRSDISENLKALDAEGAYFLVERNLDGFLDHLSRTGATICGNAPLSVLQDLLGKETKGVFLHRERSGEPNIGTDPSVGYVALAFVDPLKEAGKEAALPPKPDWVAPAWSRSDLTPEEQKTLLKLARDVIAAKMSSSTPFRLSNYDITPRLMAPQGAFVTLQEKGDLRGCIGCITAPGPLYVNVARMANEAAFGDPRFPPLTEKELEAIHVEISALMTPDRTVDRSPTRPIESTDQIRIGQDGLTIQKSGRSGIFLPQVPVEQKWDLNQYLVNLCGKAGLPPEAWHDARIERFTAQVFGEE
ncbi:MAG: AmmeMemoRadiSam system protein B [Candidatus Sumerlaeota bacterium]|nr:AmmeMemoRadiSam system protein B [Candidatus Sumerlaeota bacterium]